MTRLPIVTAVAGTMLLSLSVAALAGDGQPSGARRAGTQVQTSCGKDAKKLEVAQSSVGQSTTSTAFADVDGSTVSFNIGGNGNTCLLVDFSAQVFAPGAGHLMNVHAIRDDNIQSVDGRIQLVAESGAFSDAHAYNFLFTDVPPGAHTVKMQFASGTNGNEVFVNDFDMAVHHK